MRPCCDANGDGRIAMRVVPNVQSAPTRGNREAQSAFRQHNVVVITFPPHLTNVRQPEDMSRARRFKSQFREEFGRWRMA